MAPWPWLDANAQHALLAHAGWAIGQPLGLARQQPAPLPASIANQHCGCFVTLERDGRLRGCIGLIESHEPLAAILPQLARSAAFADHRFAPLQAAEAPQLELTINLLGPRQPLPARDSKELAAQLQPGYDGLWLSDGTHSATFLPTVWQQLPAAAEFISALLAKGGWHHWPAEMHAWRYHSHSFSAPLAAQWR